MTEGPAAGQVAPDIFRIDADRPIRHVGPERPTAFTGRGSAALVELERLKPDIA
jgi:hypothetical protein